MSTDVVPISNKSRPPTHRALMATLQFLADVYPTSFDALVQESGEKYDTTVLPNNNTLLNAMDTYVDILDAEKTLEERVEKKRIDELLQTAAQSSETAISTLHGSHDYIHESNIIAVDLAYGSPVVATGSTDKTVKVTDYEQKKILFTTPTLASPVLSVAFNPVETSQLVASCMNGSHCIIDYKQQQIVQEFKDHSKYVVQVQWSGDGKIFATASHDCTLRLYKRNEESGKWGCVHQLDYKVVAIEFVPGSSMLIVSVRDDCCLHIVDTNTGLECGKLNMNSRGDDHVSFAALDITCNSTGQWTLVTTDKHRSIMFETGSNLQVRNFYGAINDQLSNPRGAWGSNGKYVYSTSQDLSIVGWDVFAGKMIAPLEGHTRTVRDLCSRNGLLASASYDRTVKIWTP